ncbi:hypothetical protein K432DRAFT_412831 [Lepidopterella palustris CBS 459.81]|uniref:Amino acid transporter transmembrane domain-containing protein n=1 Tax=Lepidopterella palustris CBS 459.81 TaxID=1314670 RepID=A0A8E2ELV4_9PEZI|nr:hypothetical protein K432DRAFT_412831 [Lepidopterella palustris CBS 459.81]
MRSGAPVRDGMRPAARTTDEVSDNKPSYKCTLVKDHDRDPEKRSNPFGDEEGAEVKYRTMRWCACCCGMAYGIISIIGLSLLATYTGYSCFKITYPYAHNMADVDETVSLIFSIGSHILTLTMEITGHATYMIVWGVITMVVLWLFTLPRTLKLYRLQTSTQLTDPLQASPNPHIDATVRTTFAKAILSVSNIIFAYAGHVAMSSFISEFRDPTEFPKAPALGSPGYVLMKVTYGIALPIIFVAGVIYGHVASKYVYVRRWR